MAFRFISVEGNVSRKMEGNWTRIIIGGRLVFHGGQRRRYPVHFTRPLHHRVLHWSIFSGNKVGDDLNFKDMLHWMLSVRQRTE